MRAACILPLVLGTLAPAAPLYSITDLGTMGGLRAEALGLSDGGQAVGMTTTLFGNMHAIDFSASGNIDLTFNSGAWQGIATGVNGSGQISGTQYIGGQAFATIWQNGAAEVIAGAGSYAQASIRLAMWRACSRLPTDKATPSSPKMDRWWILERCQGVHGHRPTRSMTAEPWQVMETLARQ